ncbi:Dopamine receptor 1 [Trichoplax sp. H2]|nr:Dopamine receptor 1 [Trichoplax sp. H2]|eukprot:RDD46423.1 Dopamine receptor 1 [Trichoplax sp. H2]
MEDNFSLVYNYGNLTDDPLSNTQIIICSIILTLATLLSLIGNSLVITVIIRNRPLHTNAGMLMANLAVADFLVGLVIMFPTLIAFICQKDIYPRIACVAQGSAITVLVGASTVTILAITADRFISIFLSLRYNSIVTTAVIIGTIAFSWLFATVASTIPLLGLQKYGLGRYEFLHGMSYCWLDPLQVQQNNVIISIIGFYVVLEIFIITTCYLVIFIYARQSIRKVIHLSVGDLPKGRPKITKTTKTVMIVVGVFMFCWMPSLVNKFLIIFKVKTLSLSVRLIFTWLTFFNSAANPIIYSIFNRNFITGVRNLFKKSMSERSIIVSMSERRSRSFRRRSLSITKFRNSLLPMHRSNTVQDVRFPSCNQSLQVPKIVIAKSKSTEALFKRRRDKIVIHATLNEVPIEIEDVA